MSAKTKTVLKGFDYMCSDDFAKFLMDMAAKGWHFKEWGVGLKFEKGEPENAVYAVEVFQKASENDMRPEPNTEEFAEYCETAGWKFVDAKQKFCIFKKIDEDAVELFTPEERVTNAFKGTISGSAWLLLFLYGLNAFLQWEKLFNVFELVIFSNAFFFSIVAWNLMFVGQLIHLVYAFFRKRKLMKQIRLGHPVYIGREQDKNLHFGLKDLYVAILFLILVVYFFMMKRTDIIVMNIIVVVGTLGFSVLLNKLRPEHDTSVMMQLVFNLVIGFMLLVSAVIGLASDGVNDEILEKNMPLKISDYREVNEEVRDISYYHEENPLGSLDEYFIYGVEQSNHYDIYESQYDMILDKVWENITSGKKYNEGAVDCTKDWDALKAIRNKEGIYYVRYDNVILKLADNGDEPLSKEQIDIILDKLELR